MDPTTKALIETIGATGYAVMVGADSDANEVVEATDDFRSRQRRAEQPQILTVTRTRLLSRLTSEPLICGFGKPLAPPKPPP